MKLFSGVEISEIEPNGILFNSSLENSLKSAYFYIALLPDVFENSTCGIFIALATT